MPKLNKSDVLAVENWLKTKYEMRRTPTATARLLVMICRLYEKDREFPSRTQAAEVSEMTVFGVDAALSIALSRRVLTIEVRAAPGGIAQRESSVRKRYYVPSPELLDVLADRRVAVPA